MVNPLSECNNHHSATRTLLFPTPRTYLNLLHCNFERTLYTLVVFDSLSISSNITLMNDRCVLHSEMKVCLPLTSAFDFHSSQIFSRCVSVLGKGTDWGESIHLF